MNKFFNSKSGQVVTIGVVGMVGIYLAQKYATKAAADVLANTGAAINPVNKDNIFSQAGNAVGGVLTGDDNFDLGIWIYDKFH